VAVRLSSRLSQLQGLRAELAGIPNDMLSNAARQVLTVVAFAAVVSHTCKAQLPRDVPAFLRHNPKLSSEEIANVQAGKPAVKSLKPREPDEIVLFGAIYIEASPAAYVKLAAEPARQGGAARFISFRAFSSPPVPGDMTGFSFEQQDIEALKSCKPGDCDVQMPAAYIDVFRKSVNWSAPDASNQVNDILRRTALERLLQYQKKGNDAFGIYHDKEHPVTVSKQFEYMLRYSSALPQHVPAFYNYLLRYPQGKPPNTGERFYWAKVDFGLKPTLRIVHQIATEDRDYAKPAYIVAEKQLYANHYFQTALDLSFCLPHETRNGFYLLRVIVTEQSGLSGVKGSMLRRNAVSRSLAALKDSLAQSKAELERQR
jgi:hypothetical protein